MLSATADRQLILRGLDRCSLPKFLLWIAPWTALLAVGVYAAALCLIYGLNQTNMDNRFAFGLWIFLDLTVIALGAGAFFTGFLLYVLKKTELKAVINSAVVVGLLFAIAARWPFWASTSGSRCAHGSPSGTRTRTRC